MTAPDASMMVADLRAHAAHLRCEADRYDHAADVLEGLIAAPTTPPELDGQPTAPPADGPTELATRRKAKAPAKKPAANAPADRGGSGPMYPCGDCDRVFDTRQGLSMHQARAHKGTFGMGATDRDGMSAGDRVVQLLGDGKERTVDEIARRLDLPGLVVSTLLKRLVKAKRVGQKRDGRWGMPVAGVTELGSITKTAVNEAAARDAAGDSVGSGW